MFIFHFYFGKRRASSLYICKSMIVCTKPVNRLNNYLQFSQDTNICQASDPSLPCAHRLFQQNHTDNHQVRLNLIIREGEPSPNLLSSEFAALNSAHCGGKACCWQQGWRMVTGSGMKTKAGRPGGEWRRLEGARGRQSGKFMEKTMKAGLQHSLLW